MCFYTIIPSNSKGKRSNEDEENPQTPEIHKVMDKLQCNLCCYDPGCFRLIFIGCEINLVWLFPLADPLYT